MKLPRNLSGAELIKALKIYPYEIGRQKGRHIRMRTVLQGEHHVTVPDHDPIKTGTLSSILNEVATHF
jgi:predicted RNA binding protein YcfA (HicA-like mRNA interferase family)